MELKNVTLYRVNLSLKNPFVTHAGSVKKREVILVKATDENGNSGWGECVAFSTPFYTAETINTAWWLLINQFIPLLKESAVSHPSDIPKIYSLFQGNQMAKASIEMALWDLYAKQLGKPLAQVIGGNRKEIEVGVVISLSEDIEILIPKYLKEGYKRFKVKVKKGQEKETIEKIQTIEPELPIMIDGNGAYDPDDMNDLTQLDRYNMVMIEQPFKSGDFYLHKQLQANINTPVCLDESIMSFHDAYQSIMLESCKMINIKIGRVGGLTEAIRIHDFCQEHQVPVWCGGMLETGISRAHNIALASLPNFTIPGDISASARYWERDVIIPEVQLKSGKIQIPPGDGIGYLVDETFVEQLATNVKTINLKSR